MFLRSKNAGKKGILVNILLEKIFSQKKMQKRAFLASIF
jgi:hypothetical protein